MMKIGIITIVDYTNYGNRLQNYAVYKILQSKFNCKATTLVSYKNKPFYDGKYILWLKNFIVKKLCVFPNFAEKRFGPTVTRWSNFHNWSKYIPTKNYYKSIMLPKKLNDEYDYFFVGSDQVWNYHFSASRFDDFFLRFSDDEKKVAISASFGVDKLPDKWKETYKIGLEKFKYISVRENAGQKIIFDILNKEVPVLLDPVMMLSKEEWIKVSKKTRVDCSKPYVLKYYLGDENEEEKIDKWAQKNGYEIYELLNKDVPELYSAGPGEFLTLINNATLVCSDSFHCIAFSIIFSRPFIVYSRLGDADYMTSRLETLLNTFNFQNRWKHMLKKEEYLQCDFSESNSILNQEQKKFTKYVEQIINSK